MSNSVTLPEHKNKAARFLINVSVMARGEGAEQFSSDLSHTANTVNQDGIKIVKVGHSSGY